MARRRVSRGTASAVRQRARFKCEAEDCDKFTLNQFAHIIPDADGGNVDVNNILWLCESCHRLYEAKGKTGLMRESLIESLGLFRGRPKYDSLIDGSFEELRAHPKRPIIAVLGSVRLINPSTIFSEPLDSYNPSFLKVSRDGYKLAFQGLLKNIKVLIYLTNQVVISIL